MILTSEYTVSVSSSLCSDSFTYATDRIPVHRDEEVAEANVRSRSRALYGVHLIQVVGFTELLAYGQTGVNGWAKCLLKEEELHLFVVLFGLQEWNFSEFMDTAF